ncbi:MAG: hypothetical protein M0Z69_05755 [Actinomycetota bacterium]|nr:hypothetical protein [Actinomycetota bacterium]
MNGPELAGALDALRLTLHVLAATIWVGGQLTVAGLLPTVRTLGGDAPRQIARAFGRLQWPAYGVLIATGIWNVTALDTSRATHSWQIVLGVKIGVALLAGLGAFLHQRSKTTAGLAVWGSVAGLASVGALVLGVLLGG